MNPIPDYKQTSRRDFLFRAAACIATAGVLRHEARASAWQLPPAPPAPKEHRVPRGDGHNLYVQEYPGAGPALVLLHGFPDDLHIFDRVVPYLAKEGRHVVAMDFLGFGGSDKPDGYAYSFDQQRKDIEAVVDFMGLERVIPVAHDAGGVAAINYLFATPQRVSGLCLLNTFYGDTETLRFPELIEFFADPELKALNRAVMNDPKQMAFLLNFQNHQFEAGAPQEQKDLFDNVLQPIINENFAQKPSAGPAFAAMTGGLRQQMKIDDRQLQGLEKLTIPTSIIWGRRDPYLNEGVARDFATRIHRSSLHFLDAGHWPQIDIPDEVASLLTADLK
jgi:pimeloyl-ACP methyl ester carboxylesterase